MCFKENVRADSRKLKNNRLARQRIRDMNISLLSLKYSSIFLQEFVISIFLGLLLWEYIQRTNKFKRKAVLRPLLSIYFIIQLTRVGVVFELEQTLIFFQKLNIITILTGWYVLSVLLLDLVWPDTKPGLRTGLIRLFSLPLVVFAIIAFLKPELLGVFHELVPTQNAFYRVDEMSLLFKGISIFYRILMGVAMVLFIPTFVRQYQQVGLWSLMSFCLFHGLSESFITDMGSEGVLVSVRLFLFLSTFTLSAFHYNEENLGEFLKSAGKQLDHAIVNASNLKVFLALSLILGNVLSINRILFELIFHRQLHYTPHAYTTFSVGILSLLMLIVIRRMNVRLKEQVEELDFLNQKLQLSANKEAEANKTKSLFLANISHEIRTPMNGVVGMANLIKNENNDTLKSAYINNLLNSTESMMVIINDLLDFSKIEAGKLDIVLRKVALNKIIDPLEQTQSNLAHKKGLYFNVDIRLDAREEVLTDSIRLQQILNNLYSNAIKFTEHGGISTILSIEHDGEKNWVKTQISDTGIGIPPEKINKLFSKFSQVDTSITKKYGGTGLGLSIVKQLTELMGGHISVESHVGRGSTFTLTMPYITKSKKDRCGNGPNTDIACKHFTSCDKKSMFDQLNVLVAEDNPINQLIIRKTLEKLNILPVICNDGKEAVMAALKDYFDLILMDLQMPEMDGITATHHILNNKQGKQPIVVALTADTNPEDRQKCKEVGMKHFILKPFKEEEIKDLLHGILCGTCADYSINASAQQSNPQPV